MKAAFLQKLLTKIPAVQPIDTMVGANPFIDAAPEYQFHAFLKAQSYEGLAVLPKWQDLQQYLAQDRLSWSAITAVLQDHFAQLTATEHKILCAVLEKLLTDKTLAAKLDARLHGRKTQTIADNATANGFDLKEQILSQYARLLLNPQQVSKEHDLFSAWRRYHCDYSRLWRQSLATLPAAPQDALEGLGALLGINDLETYCRTIMQHNSGWFGYLKSHSASVLEDTYSLITIWLANEWLYVQQLPDNVVPIESSLAKNTGAILTLSELASFCAIDLHYPRRDMTLSLLDLQLALLQALEKSATSQLALANKPLPVEPSPEEVWLFCMDPRSERLRRLLEQDFKATTYGCAGFFNLPLSIETPSGDHLPHYPGEAAKTVTRAQQPNKRRQLTHQLITLLEQQRKKITSAFLHYELFGAWYYLQALCNNVSNSSPSKPQPLVSTALSGEHFQLVAQQVADLMISIGLKSCDQQIVYVVGHGSHNPNNHYGSTLQCAACAGHNGSYNAQILCQLLNDAAFRSAAAELGFHIAAHCTFLPILHNTADDTMIRLPAIGKNDTTSEQKFRRADQMLTQINQLKASRKAGQDIMANPANWSQMVPEFGLAGHTSLVIGPRWLTAPNQETGQAFLHSYDYQEDPQGSLLAAILAGPAYVAHQLNMQYFFSALSNHRLGSGDKARHTLLPKVGVCSGDSFELRHGLPEQCFTYRDQVLHTPSRLFVYIYAPEEIIALALAQAESIKQLAEQQWLVIKDIPPSAA